MHDGDIYMAISQMSGYIVAEFVRIRVKGRILTTFRYGKLLKDFREMVIYVLAVKALCAPQASYRKRAGKKSAGIDGIDNVNFGPMGTLS